ncbi:MarR family winged helix-turn-helix transcriptional regulator [Virgibacillus salexigens]|uniref:MarR family winged helix-turn-helix transcriptional regulator n=1 Tax=Virgibacillus salexigens TaxID=61016 RepID=UPI00190BBFC3|nr:MarR family winged helix-turn-helix transcriptional regulator [Virgibacillus salexigens]
MYSQEQREGFIRVYETLKLYKRITPKKLNGEESIDKQNIIKDLYVDLLPNKGIIRKLLSDETFILLGRRGTGKSTLFARAQYDIITQRKNLSAYVNAKSVVDDMKFQNNSLNIPDLEGVLETEQLGRLLLIKKFLNDLFESIVVELKREEQNLFEKITSRFRDNRIDSLIKRIEDKIENPDILNINSIVSKQTRETETTNKTKSAEAGATGSTSANGVKDALVKIYAKAGYKKEIASGLENESLNIFAKLFNVGDIISDIKQLLDITSRDKLYIFIDDFSELTEGDMELFYQTLLNPIYNSARDEIVLKIAAYPGRITYGELEAGKYDSIQIDAFELYGQNIVEIERKSSDFIRRLIKNRISFYCKTTPDTFFDTSEHSMEEYYLLLFEASMNIPRTLGHILSQCYDNVVSYDKKITKSDILNAVEMVYRKITKTYFDKEHKSQGVYKEKLDVYTQHNLIEALCEMALELKVELPKTNNQHFSKLEYAHSSHFQIRAELVSFLESLEFNGLVHKVSTIAPKSTKNKKANIDVFIYAFDYGLCQFNKILYGRPERTSRYSKYYQQRRFDLSETLINTLSSNKKIVCKNADCGAQYDINELPMIEQFDMMCRKCYQKTCEVDYDESITELVKENLKKAQFTKEELDILQVLEMYVVTSTNFKAYPLEIGQELDISYQLVSRIARGLIDSELVIRKEDKTNNNRPYYEITEKGKKTLSTILEI